MRNSLILATAALLSTALPAFAADLMVTEPAPAVSSGYDWSGAYVGVNVGGNSGSVDWTGDYYDGAVLDDSSSDSFDTSGWQAGLDAGFNVQSGSLVFGIEGDVNWTDLSGEGPASLTSDVSANIDWIASLRGRVGVALDSILLYGTAGFAYGSGDLTITNLDGPGDDRTADLTASGWTAGVGAEVALDSNWSLKAEYRYTDLTADEVTYTDVPFSGTPLDDSLVAGGNLTSNLVTVGVNYKF